MFGDIFTELSVDEILENKESKLAKTIAALEKRIENAEENIMLLRSRIKTLEGF